ncbi:hypothetical protein TorRG33x02_185620 [Trema orientale]|uniref:Uncharacterized protein n=1 Tax=Trema orientale TaxID=63057 RepID=A0A2P5EJI3_TREOI|nr:hypothetical protein TorRG33x02_185620 [Trema orientale]
MAKLAHHLKKGFLHLIDTIKSCKTTSGTKDVEEPKLRSVQKVSIQGRGIRIKAPKGPELPGVPKGPPAQTS